MDNVYTSFRPVFLFARILGLFPMSFEGPITKGFLKTKLFGLTCSGLAFSSLSALIFVQIKYNHELDHPTISKVAWYISFDFTMISLLLQFGLQFIKRNEIRKFLTLLNEFDDQAKKLGVQINHKSHKTTALVAIIAIIIISLLTFGLVPLISIMWDIYPDLIAYFSYLTANIYKLFFTYQFTLATLSVRERFKLLNFYLNRTLSRRRRKIFNAESSKNLQMLTRLYLDLCDLVDHVNSTFTFHLIFVVLIAFIVAIFSGFAIVRLLLSPDDDFFYPQLVTHTTFILLQYFMITLMAYSGSSTTSTSEDTQVILGSLINDEDENASDLIKSLTSMRTRNLNIQNIFFVVNWNILVTTTSTVVTYLIITCQFDIEA